MMELVDHTQCEVENTWQNFEMAIDKIKDKIIVPKEIAQQL
jgi:hypothetical protein